MANYAVHAQLTANTVMPVAFAAALGFDEVEVFNRGTTATTDDIYYTTDGSDPAVAGADTYIVTPGSSFPVSLGTRQISGVPTIKLISAGTPKFSVTLV